MKGISHFETWQDYPSYVFLWRTRNLDRSEIIWSQAWVFRQTKCRIYLIVIFYRRLSSNYLVRNNFMISPLKRSNSERIQLQISPSDIPIPRNPGNLIFGLKGFRSRLNCRVWFDQKRGTVPNRSKTWIKFLISKYLDENWVVYQFSVTTKILLAIIFDHLIQP